MNPKAAPSLRSPRSGAVSHASSRFENEREREWERKGERVRETWGCSRFLSFPPLLPPSIFASSHQWRPNWTLLLLVAWTEVFVSSPSPQLCYETPSNPIRITDGREGGGGGAGGHGKWLPSSSSSSSPFISSPHDGSMVVEHLSSWFS